jgi:hypothetical protein
VGFAVVVTNATRIADGAQPSELDTLINRNLFLQEYLAAPGLIRKGEKISRREVIKHMAIELGGVHVGKSEANVRDLLADAENKLFIEGKTGSLRTLYIEAFAIGQAVGRSDDFKKLAARLLASHHAVD